MEVYANVEGRDRTGWKSREKAKMKCRMNARLEKSHKSIRTEGMRTKIVWESNRMGRRVFDYGWISLPWGTF